MTNFEKEFNKKIEDVDSADLLQLVMKVQSSRSKLHRRWEKEFTEFLNTPVGLTPKELAKAQANYQETLQSITCDFNQLSGVVIEIIETLQKKRNSPESLNESLESLQAAERKALEATVQWQIAAGKECDQNRLDAKEGYSSNSNSSAMGSNRYGHDEYRNMKQCMQEVTECEREVREEFLGAFM